jgi:hypothetical protein
LSRSLPPPQVARLPHSPQLPPLAAPLSSRQLPPPQVALGLQA